MNKIRLFLAGLAAFGVAMSFSSTTATAQVRRTNIVLDDGTGVLTTVSGTPTGVKVGGDLTITSATAGAILLGGGTSPISYLLGTGTSNRIPVWNNTTGKWEASTNAIGDLAYQSSTNFQITDLHFDNTQDHTLDVLQSAVGVSGHDLAISAGNGNGAPGGTLSLSAGTGTASGNIDLTGAAVNLNATDIVVGSTSKFSNNTGNTVGSDNTGAISAGGTINWLASGTGFVQTLYNSATGANKNGLEVKVASTDANAYALDVSQQAAQGTQGTSLFNVRSNGDVNVPGTLNVGTLNLTSVFTGDFMLSGSAAHSIGIEQNTSAGAGNTLTVLGGNANTTGSGGDVILDGGAGSGGGSTGNVLLNNTGGATEFKGKVTYTHNSYAAGATINLASETSIVVRITDDNGGVANASANAITAPASPLDGQVLYITNNDADATSGAFLVGANSTAMFVYFGAPTNAWIRTSN